MSAPTISPLGNIPHFIGNPVVFQITPTGSGVNGSFYRVKITVDVWMDGQKKGTFVFSVPVETKMVNNVLTAQTANFDASSALQAVADLWQPQAAPSTFVYPVITFTINAIEEWMIDGVIYSSDAALYPNSGSVVICVGSLTDKERISQTSPARYSRKPTSSPEICFHDYQVIVPGPTSAIPAVSLYLAGDPGEQYFPSNKYHVITPPPDGYEIRFINSLGVHENIFVYGLPQKNTHITTEQYVIARQETLTQFSRGLAIKKNDYETWLLSSGPVDEQWASWYVHEFLTRRWLWIKIRNNWIACHVLPEETTPLSDRITPARHEVQFKLQLDINGSPL